MFRTLMVIALLPMALASAAPAQMPSVTHYLGTVGENMPVAMMLSFDRLSSDVNGSYVYCQYGKPIPLAGSRTYESAPVRHIRITLTETRTGTGTLELAGGDSETLSGTWRSDDGTRSYPVSLSPAAKTVTLVSARSDRYEIRTGYLQLTADTAFVKALNAHLEAAALAAHEGEVQSFAAHIDEITAEGLGTDRLPHLSESTPYLLYASDTLVSIRDLGYTFTGGAHGYSGFGATNYAWVRGVVVEIQPAMIVPESQWPALRRMCVSELKAQGASWPEDIKFEGARTPTLNVTSRGLLAIFNPYEAGSYAEGPYIVSLPFARVKSLIPADSLVAALAAE